MGGVKLVGTYFGFWEAHGYHGSEVEATLYLGNLTTKHVAEATYADSGGGGFCYEPFGSPGPPGGRAGLLTVPAGYLLTSTGVAAWRADRCTSGPVEDIEALDSNTDQVATVDTAAAYGVLDNLQLYQCAAGCRPGTTVLAWTHDGVWRYTTIN